MKQILEYCTISAAVLLGALITHFFMIPSGIVMGNITGLSIMLSHLSDFPVSGISFILNALCLLLGFFFVGKSFGLKAIYISALMPAYLCILERVFPSPNSPSGNLILDMICTVLLMSFASAVLFLHGAASGGTDIIAKIISNALNLEIGAVFSAIGVVIVLFSSIIYNLSTTIVGLLSTYASGLALDYFLKGFVQQKKLCIVCRAKDVAFFDEYLKNHMSLIPMIEKVPSQNSEPYYELDFLITRNKCRKVLRYLRTLDMEILVVVYDIRSVFSNGGGEHLVESGLIGNIY